MLSDVSDAIMGINGMHLNSQSEMQVCRRHRNVTLAAYRAALNTGVHAVCAVALKDDDRVCRINVLTRLTKRGSPAVRKIAYIPSKAMYRSLFQEAVLTGTGALTMRKIV